MPLLYKNNNCLIMLNQRRQKGMDMRGNPRFDSLGGEALKHFVSVRIHAKPGDWSNKIVDVKEDGTKTTIARDIDCELKKVNTSETQDETATFMFYYKKTADHEVGVDTAADVVNVGKTTGVIKVGGAWLSHKTFPGGKLQGANAVKTFLEENPAAYDEIRKDVLAAL